MQQENMQQADMAQTGEVTKRERRFRYENGRLYFSKQTERTVFFVLTLAMLVWGMFEGVGAFGG